MYREAPITILMSQIDITALLSTAQTLRQVRHAMLDFIALGTLDEALEQGLLADRIIRDAKEFDEPKVSSSRNLFGHTHLDD